VAEEAKPLTRAVLSIPAETAMYRPQMAARPQDPTRPHAPVESKPPPPPAPPDFDFDSITIDPAPPPEIPRPPEVRKVREPAPEQVASVPTTPAGVADDESWYCSLPAVTAPPKRVERPALPRHAPIRPAPIPPACTEQTELVDASVLVDIVRQGRKGKALPAPARPLSAPLVLGVLAAVTGVMLPLAAAFESNRIFGILGFCVSGLLLPLAPLAWITGLAAERRRREQGLRTERRVIVGRLLGQWGTLLLAAEGTIGLILVAAFRVTGKLPVSFWGK